jgi:agmatinase
MMSYRELFISSSPKISTGNESSKVYIMGVPFDFTTSYRPGSRFGPLAVRQAYWNIEIVDRKLNVNAEKIQIFDIGDLSYFATSDEMINSLSKVSKEVFSENKVLGTIGGEHLITYPILKGLKNVSLVVFDAHLDLRDTLYGLKISHATFLRRLLEDNKSLKVYHIGSHTFVDEELDFAISHGVDLYTYYDITEKKIESLKNIIRNDEEIYVSVDMDVLDPSCAPGVANPEPEGLNYEMLFNLLRSLKGKKIIGFDVVETNPLLDPSGITSIAAAKVLSLLVIDSAGV